MENPPNLPPRLPPQSPPFERFPRFRTPVLFPLFVPNSNPCRQVILNNTHVTRLDRISKIFGSDSKSLWNVTIAPGIPPVLRHNNTRLDEGGGGGAAMRGYEVRYRKLETDHQLEDSTWKNGFTNRLPSAENDRATVAKRYAAFKLDVTD